MTTLIMLLDELTHCGIKLGLDEQGDLLVRGDKSALTHTLIAKIKELKPEIVAHFKQNQKKNIDDVIEVVSRSTGGEVPSYTQQRLWLLDQIDGGSAHYNMPTALTLTGTLDVQALNQAFTSILERHESLRTCFAKNEEGHPLQVIQAASPFYAELTDLSELAEGTRQLKLSELVTEEAARVFDLSRDLMLRAQLIKIASDEHILLVTMHHIASDGWSMAILINEFSALYSAYVQGQENPLPPLAIQYADYAHWQRNWMQGEVLDEQLGYWTKQLAGLPVVHSLPLDYTRPVLQSFVGETHRSQVDTATSKALSSLCQAQGTTLFMGLHATFSVLLARYSNGTDIVVGSPIANREQAEVANLIGFFANTLVLRSDLSANPSFTDLLNQSKGMLLEAYAHQQMPFEQLVERLQPERSLSHSALFQIMLVLQNNEQGSLDLAGLTLSPVEQSCAGVAKYDLTLYVVEGAEVLDLSWEYNADLFESTTISRMAEHFALLLTGLVINPDENVFRVDMLSAQERHQLLVEWNDTAAEYPKDKCIHELFEAHVENNPDAIAVIFEETQLSYGELNQKANQLAHYLINEKQVKPDTLVGICVERSLEMVIGILAILKAGGAYVPLDPEYPEARLKYMLDDANLTTVLTQRHLRETTPVSDEQAMCLDDESIQPQLHIQSAQNPIVHQLGLSSSHLAYVIYTSGSTGNPKGVMVEHINVVNFLATMAVTPGITAADCLLAVTSTSFDIHGLELFLPLINGAELVIAANVESNDPHLLLNLMGKHQVSVMQATPATWKMLLDVNWQQKVPLKILCGGEALSLHLAKALLNHQVTELWNMYGPTETTIWSSAKQILLDADQVFMGKPIANTQVYIASDLLQLAPLGVAGELLIGGAGTARGYLNRPDLTAEKFIPNPFHDKTNPASSERLYKTGDLVRWLPDGNLEFLGRIDHQVKIRGFRIELGEIENTLSTHVDVKDAIVLAKETATTGDKYLIAYVVTEAVEIHDESEAAITARHTFIGTLRHHLSETLPDYMVPSAFMLLDKLPLTPNGKVNRKSLPAPDVREQQAMYVPPQTETQKILCEIWQEVLGVERVGITDNFFQLGGHSLLMMNALSKISRKGYEILAKDFIGNPTIKLLSTIRREKLIGSTNNGKHYCLPNRQLLFKDAFQNHWNLSGILNIKNVNPELLKMALCDAVRQHESLRLKFKKNGNIIEECIVDSCGVDLDIVDVSLFKDKDKIIKNIADENHSAMRLDSTLYKFTLFVGFDDGSSKFLWIIHHALIDARSVPILMEEIMGRYLSSYVGIEFNSKRTISSIYDWAEKLHCFVNSEECQSDKKYWLSLPYHKAGTLVDFPENVEINRGDVSENYGNDVWLSRILDSSTNNFLISNVKLPHGVSTAEIIFVSLIDAISAFTMSEYVRFELVTLGRSKIIPGVNLDESIGWFTDYVPVLINLPVKTNPIEKILEYRRQYGAIPNGGLTFNAFKHLCEDSEIRQKFQNIPYAEMNVNFIPPRLNEDSSMLYQNLPVELISLSQEDSGRSHGNIMGEIIWSSYIEISAPKGDYVFKWLYRDNVYEQEKIQAVMDLWIAKVKSNCKYLRNSLVSKSEVI